MKKLGITLLLIALGGMALTMAQPSKQGQANPEIKKYFTENILPVVESEQQNFYKALSEDEMKKIEELKVQLDSQMAGMGKGKSRGNRQGNRQGNKQGGQQQGRAMMQTFLDEANTIADAHPKQKKHFEKTMDDNKDKWLQDLTKIREENNLGGGRGRSADGGPIFDHLKNPGWLLLWDKDQKNFQQMARMGKSKGQGMHGNGNCEGGKHGNGMGMKNGMGPNQNMNPELSAEIRAYAEKNIIPVIAKERKDFDSNLSATEKKQIALAQGKRKARRIMFREWYKSEDFEAGARRDDPNFDMMREDMQKSMEEIRVIASNHSTQIESSITNIRPYSKVWEPEIKAIAAKYQNGQNKKSGTFARSLRQIESPIQFLLFNPNETESTSLFDIDRKEMLRVELFPNPATSHATIRISGLNSQQTEVNLFSKEGSLIKSLYNEKVEGEEITFGFSVADLENNIYIIKVKAGEQVIARKIVVQK